MSGRHFLRLFLARAVRRGCTGCGHNWHVEQRALPVPFRLADGGPFDPVRTAFSKTVLALHGVVVATVVVVTIVLVNHGTKEW